MKNWLVWIGLMIAVVGAVSCSSVERIVRGDGTSAYEKTDRAALEKKDAIVGLVRDSVTGKGVPNAIVEIKNANMGVGYYKVTTDSGGRFRVDDFIKNIRYAIEISAAGYVTFTSTEKIVPGEYTLDLQREAVLAGTVRDSAGAPIEGVEVKVRGMSGDGGRPTMRTATTGRDGSYRFDKLVESGYAVTFEKAGLITETASIQQIKRGETFSLPMLLYRPASLAGRITIKGVQAPAINMEVTLKGKAGHGTNSFQDGSYLIQDVKPGYYKLEISHRGFYNLAPETIRIAEGARIAGKDFVVTPKPPKVAVQAYRYTFSPGTKVEFNLRAFRLEKVRARIYSVPLATLMSGRVDPVKADPKMMGFTTVSEWDDSIKNFEPYEWRYQTIEPAKPLPTGAYCIEVRGAGNTYDRKFFTVTSVGLVVKRSRDSIFAYVSDLVTNRPIKDAKIVIFDNTPDKNEHRTSTTPYKPPERIEKLPVIVVNRGATSESGVYQFSRRTTQHLSVLAVGPDRSFAFCSTGHPLTFDGEMNKFFIYTDRPVYRAGDTVHYKIVAKKRGTRFTPIANRKVQFEISNSEFEEKLDDGELALDEWGTAHGKLELERDCRLGEIAIRVGETKENLYGAGRFYIEQYRKPEFKIDITPSREYFVNGDTAEFRVEAKYFFGAPLKGALVRYRFYERRLRDTDTRYWWEEDDGASEGYYNRIKLEGEKYVDENGVAVMRLDCGTFPFDREVSLEVTAVDKSNVSITSSSRVRVGRGDYYIKINPKKNFFADNESKRVEVRTVAQDGKPVSAAVRVKLFNYIWKPWQRVYVHAPRPVFEASVTTNAKGIATVDLPGKFDVYGEFDFVAEGRDRRENAITASRVLWVYSARGAKIESRFRNLELAVNENRLEKAGAITCLLKSRFTDAYVCLTVEGRDIYASKVVKMDGNVMPVTIDIKPQYAPNLFISATMQRSRALFTATTEITLPNADTGLSIALETDKKEYLPGEKARVRLKVTDERGAPLAADVSLGTVDESIYYIRSDHTPKMADFFYSKISNWVLTNYSYPITLLAGAGKDDKVKVREKFADTAYWNPRVRTGPDGTAALEFTLPDNLTTWRITARGHDRTGRVGESVFKFLSTQDLIARIGKPRFLVEGDRLSLIGIVNSNTTRGLAKVDTEFTVDGAAVRPDAPVSISLPPYGTARSYYPVTVPEGKERVQVFMKAVADPKARDALSIKIPVESRGAPFKVYSAGDMAANTAVTLAPVGDTDDFSFRPSDLTISVNAGPIMQMVKATTFLSEYPYGCIEQTLNRFMPVLVLKNLLKHKGVSHLMEDVDIDEKVRAGIARIQGYQNDDGTWGWWSGGRGNEFVTGYVLYSLNRARALGFSSDVNDETVKKGIDAIGTMLSSTQGVPDDAKAYLLYVSALWGRWQEKAFSDLMELRQRNAYQLAFLIRAIRTAKSNVPRKDIGEKTHAAMERVLPEYVNALKQLQKRDARGVFWASEGAQRWGWQGGDTEMSSHVLAALVSVGDRSPVASQLVSSISKRGRNDAWLSTKETASVFLAFCDYLAAAGNGVSGRGDIAFAVEGKKVADVSFDLSKRVRVKDLVRKIKLSDLGAKKSYQVVATGTAGSDVSFECTMAGNLYFKDAGLLSFLKSPERSLNALSNGIGLVRRFNSVTRVRDMNNSEYLVPQDMAGDRKISVGDEILVKLKFRADDDFEYLVLEDYLPSGFEVVNQNAYGDYRPYIHAERWDNRMVYFFSKIPKGEIVEIAYIMRAELPGTFIVKPARMECMYEPTIQGWSAPARFTVEKK